MIIPNHREKQTFWEQKMNHPTDRGNQISRRAEAGGMKLLESEAKMWSFLRKPLAAASMV
jgi:hypothetical protein